MSAILELEHVGKSYERGPREDVVLDDVSFELDGGEFVGVWGPARSGRSTLLRIAGGIERPDTGRVLFEGRDLDARRGDALGGGIGYCRTVFNAAEGDTVFTQLMVVQFARGAKRATARVRTREALRRAGVENCATRRPSHLAAGELARVALARALVLQPRLLLFDEPAKGIDPPERDEIMQLLRDLAKNGVAVLITGNLSGLADRALSIGQGKVRGSLTPELASVSYLARARTS